MTRLAPVWPSTPSTRLPRGPQSGRDRPARHRGFTLIELMIVMALIAIVSATVALSLRDPAANQLEQEGARLAALLESARAESRAAGVDVRWEVASAQATAVDGSVVDFRFVGLPTAAQLPVHWLQPGVVADIVGARALLLGPEPFIGPQRVLLRLDNQRLLLATDGLGPFAVIDNDDAGTVTR